MRLLLLVVLAQAALIEPSGAGRERGNDRRGSERRQERRESREQPRSAPKSQPVPQPSAPSSGGGLIVPGNSNAPAPRFPRSHWRRRHGYWYDPGHRFWYRHDHGHWWRHDPVREVWIIERDGYEPASSATSPPAGGSWKSPDGKRLVEVTSLGEAFLYDASVSPPRLLKYLAGGAAAARFSGGVLLLDLQDGSFRLFDLDGGPVSPPSDKPPASP